MTATLFVGDYAYSSWSLRGWLLFDAFGIPKRLRSAHMRTPDFEAMQAEMAPARLVPAMRLADGLVVWDSLAMAETLAERHPEAGLWPADPALRATARSVTAEMHSGFGALRSACPMNLRRHYAAFEPAPEVLADVARLDALLAHARRLSGGAGPFLTGAAYTAADAFLTPVAARIATYGLPVSPDFAAYVAALMTHPSLRRWKAMAWADGKELAHYEPGWPERPDPFAPALTGRAVTGAAPENAGCPFSGAPPVPDALMEVRGRVIGFCNPFCRDKSAADPLAWPAVAALLA